MTAGWSGGDATTAALPVEVTLVNNGTSTITFTLTAARQLVGDRSTLFHPAFRSTDPSSARATTTEVPGTSRTKGGSPATAPVNGAAVADVTASGTGAWTAYRENASPRCTIKRHTAPPRRQPP